jgi:hypothetical protein
MLVFTTVMSLALATAAWGAPGGGKGKPQPTLVDVTMTLVEGEEGLTTLDDCDDDGVIGSLSMKRTRNGLESVEDVAPILGLYMDVAWERKYGVLLSGTGFAGCHGGTVLGSPYAWDGHLWIDIDPDGAVTDLLWHFDYYINGEVTVNEKSGKERYRQTVREHFTLSGHDLTWNTVTETVSGAFTVSHFLIENWKDGEEIGYVPFGPPHDLSFKLAVQPAG